MKTKAKLSFGRIKSKGWCSNCQTHTGREKEETTGEIRCMGCGSCMKRGTVKETDPFETAMKDEIMEDFIDFKNPRQEEPTKGRRWLPNEATFNSWKAEWEAFRAGFCACRGWDNEDDCYDEDDEEEYQPALKSKKRPGKKPSKFND